MSEAAVSPGHSNRLVHESSPYLRQHAHNPVDWYPWGAEALERARREDRPILLSIGYSACHWCHVMAHESFEDEATAALMNEHFVNIKVDREERPDLDEIYMNAVQLMTHHGGWPMTVFLTPAGEPYYGGTYFPPVDRHGMPGFRTVVSALATAYREQRGEVVENARLIVEHVRKLGQVASQKAPLDREILDQAYTEVRSGFEPVFGGFGGAPKFPQAMSLSFCLRHWRRTGDEEALAIVTKSLTSMARGGIYDHLGGGFSRYSVDERWLVPHFEKMLYDNALLARIYLETWQATGDTTFRAVAEGILAYVRRDLTDPGGGFHSAEDADSEGEEGKFYVWTPDEVWVALGPALGERFCRVYDVTAEGNFEHGKSILNLRRSIAEHARDLGLDPDELDRELAGARERLRLTREQRVRPGRDDKVIASWNGLMIAALAFAGRVLASPKDGAAALAAGEAMWRLLWVDGRLLHTVKGGVAKIGGYLDDVAALGLGFLELYELSFDPVWVTRARDLAELLLSEFQDADGGAFFYTARSGESLFARSKNPYDNATPGGNSLAVELLDRLGALSGEIRYREPAERTLMAFRDHMIRSPLGFGRMLAALDAHLGGMTQVVIAGARSGNDTRALVGAVGAGYHPDVVVALASGEGTVAAELEPLLAGKEPVDGHAAAYVCRGFTCERPVLEPDALRQRLG